MAAKPKPQVTAPPPEKSAWKSTVLTLVLVGWGISIALYAGKAGPFTSFWVDDAGIAFTFVRNIADGFGSVAHPGTERVEGFSDPTWVYLLALIYKFGGDFMKASQVAGYLFAVATLALICFFGFLPLPNGRRPWPSAFAALLVASNACFAIWNQSGLENSLYGFLLALSLFLVIRESRSKNAWPWSAPALFLLAITRPEAPAHALLAGGFLLLNDLLVYRRPTRRLFVWGGAFALLFGGYHLWHYWYYAHVFPNTYYAKVNPADGPKLMDFEDRGWKYVRSYFDQYTLWPAILFCVPAFLGRRAWREALYLALTTLFLLFFPIYSRGDWMEGWRFLSVLTIPLAMLLGLAAFHLSEIVRSFIEKKAGAKAAFAAALALAAVWVVVPFLAQLPGSSEHAKTFAEKKETTIKMIARRAEWWSGIAKGLALRPEDLTLSDMDMGGTSLNWPGVMLDIGYLLDVPMATHRYTDNWRRMMNEYFFKERRPEFIHIRRGWGEATTIPSNPQWEVQYLKLPEDRHFGRIPNGNYIRRDLLESDQPPATQLATEPFGALRLVAVEAPPAARPSKTIPLFFTWTVTERIPDLKLKTAFVREGETPVWRDTVPGLGGVLPAGKWQVGKYVRDVVRCEMPDRDGRYRLMVSVQIGAEPAVERALPVTIDVGQDAALNEVERLANDALAAAGRDPLGADQAAVLARQIELIIGQSSAEQQVAKINKLRLQTYLAAAKQAFESGQDAQAADLLARCWRIDAKNTTLKKLGWKVADRLYDNGRRQQKSNDWDAAYRTFSAACRAQPAHAWARKRAEEVRVKRY